MMHALLAARKTCARAGHSVLLSLTLLALLPSIASSAPPSSWKSDECIGVGAPCNPGAKYPNAVNPANFHPGYYMYAAGRSQSSFSLIANEPNFIGVKRLYDWNNIEPAEGTYDFSSIESDLAALRSMGKRLWIQIGMVQFDGTLPPKIPTYMTQQSKYGGQSPYYGAYARTSASGGWYPIFWNTNVEAKIAQLLAALGKRFNGEAYVEGFTLDETAIEAGSTSTGYSVSAVEAAFKANAMAAKRAFPSKIVIQQINFAPYDLTEFSSWLAQNGIAIGGPDVLLNNSTLVNSIYPLYVQYHNTVATGPDVQWPDYEKTNPDTGQYYTPEELLVGGIKLTNPWYFFWDLRQPYFSDQVLPAVRKYGPPPAAQGFYAQ